MPDKPLDRLPPLQLLAAFETAARHLSFTQAAAERFITQSAMSRQIRALEEELGVTLFERRHRALALTEDGLRLHAACSAALNTLRVAVRTVREPHERQMLALTTTPGFASLWLIPRLTGFTRAHPGIDLRLDAGLGNRNLASEGFDLAIRYSPLGGAQGRQLFAETMVPVCSPRLAEELGLPLREPADLARHTLLHLAMDGDSSGMPAEWEPWLNAWGLTDLRPAARLSFSSYAEAIAAAVAGQGVALGRRPLVDALLASGQLVTPFDAGIESARAYRLIVDPAARSRPAVKAFEAWLLAECG
ncbi:LysR substrate-binding domain-containing protein [Pelomonas sp. P7]|uniref:LysR substrate-binding domain-containing protein n=1 Tax=Pelomonas caseinilytica TaxID=2906763 RepID=A0ABS8XDK6_9BURK|nr:LysR substrate-binding domain-containing protein [Pelomonas sp. P7]MCE4536504.1 LysR substrate-binding domain-containing protein [Pelomonas sp. P7]